MSNLPESNRPGGPGKPEMSLVSYALWSLLGVTLLYAIGSSLFQGLGADYVSETDIDISTRNLLLALGASQVFFILVPTIRLAARNRLGLDRVLRFRPPPSRFWIYTLGLTFSALVLTGVWMVLQEHLLVPDFLRDLYDSAAARNLILNDEHHIGRNIPLLLLGLFAIALVPAICEELFFRGLIQRSIEEERPPRFAIVLVALIFGVIHMQPTTIIPMIGLGYLLGYLAWSSGSILPSMLLHFLFNGIQFLAANLMGEEPGAGSGEVTRGDIIGLLVAGGIALALLALIVRRIEREPINPEGSP